MHYYCSNGQEKIQKRYQVQAFCEEEGLSAIGLYPKSLVSCLKIV